MIRVLTTQEIIAIIIMFAVLMISAGLLGKYMNDGDPYADQKICIQNGGKFLLTTYGGYAGCAYQNK